MARVQTLFPGRIVAIEATDAGVAADGSDDARNGAGDGLAGDEEVGEEADDGRTPTSG